jgi:hypothetical protein
MSRRNRHGRHQPSSAPAAAPVGRAAIPAAPASEWSSTDARVVAAVQPADGPGRAVIGPQAEIPAASAPAFAAAMPAPQPPAPAPVTPEPSRPAPAPAAPEPASPSGPVSASVPELSVPAAPAPARNDTGPTCTQAQLRRFIKSRPWIPMHELRRRFGIWGDDDDVSLVRAGSSTIFVGLPPTEARMLGELLSGGDVGFELSLDPVTPIVVGVYPMRPVPRG